jgi:hypothetical protein
MALEWLPLLSSGQSSWPHIQSSSVLFPAIADFLAYNGSETGSIKLVRITEELLERKNSGFVLGNRN